MTKPKTFSVRGLSKSRYNLLRDRRKPTGWQGESYRHMLARKGVRTGRRVEDPTFFQRGVVGSTKHFVEETAEPAVFKVTRAPVVAVKTTGKRVLFGGPQVKRFGDVFPSRQAVGEEVKILHERKLKGKEATKLIKEVEKLERKPQLRTVKARLLKGGIPRDIAVERVDKLRMQREREALRAATVPSKQDVIEIRQLRKEMLA